MKKNNLFLCFCVLCACYFQMSAQIATDWITSEQQSVLDAMKIECTLPEGFYGTIYEECFDSISQNDWVLPCVKSHIISQNNHFHTSLVIFPLFTRSNDDYTRELWRNIYFSYNDKVADNDLGKYVQPDDDTKISANADTVILCPLVLNDGNKYLNKYNHCEAIYLQKDRRGFVGMYCFYDDVAASDLNKYMQKIKQVFCYKEGEIEASNIFAPEGAIVVGTPTKRKAKMVGN